MQPKIFQEVVKGFSVQVSGDQATEDRWQFSEDRWLIEEDGFRKVECESQKKEISAGCRGLWKRSSKLKAQCSKQRGRSSKIKWILIL
jgi:hypothetical protein